jgi:hypothetical protein
MREMSPPGTVAPEKYIDMKLENLQTSSEDDVQRWLSKVFAEDPTTLDTHAKRLGPNAKLGRRFENADSKEVGGVCTFTGNPDLCNSGGPGGLEIKAKKESSDLKISTPGEGEEKKSNCQEAKATNLEFQVFQQSMERLLVRATLAGHLRKFVEFAATGNNAWALVFSRADPSSSICKGRIIVFPVSYTDISMLWKAWSDSCLENPANFLTHDGFLLVQALNAASIQPAFCRIKLAATSAQSNVYFVSLPRQFSSLGVNRKVWGIEAGIADFALKVMQQRDEYLTEAAALVAIKPSYALGVFSPPSPSKPTDKAGMEKADDGDVKSDKVLAAGLDSIHLDLSSGLKTINIEGWPRGSVVPDKTLSETNHWWLRIPEYRSYAEKGGVVFMKVGDILRIPTREEVHLSGCAGLMAAHAKGWLHCDLRSPNFLHVGGSWQLIDYGLARQKHAGASHYVGKKERLGPRAASEHPDIAWTEMDDYEMLNRLTAVTADTVEC